MSEPVRVLNMFTIMDRGGAETMVMNYYRQIDRTKVQFDFMVHREQRGAYDDEIEALGGRIFRMIPIHPQNFGAYRKQLQKFFSEHTEYKIIHSHMSELGYFAFMEAEKLGVPVRICHAHSYPHEYDLKMIVRNYFKRKMLPHITHMFTCGDKAGKWLYGKKNFDKCIQLNNAIDTDKFIYSPDTDREIRKELGLEDKYIVGHVGRFIMAKNHEYLVNIFEQILKRKKNAVLLLVGKGGPLEEKTKAVVKAKQLEDKVIFLGLRDDVYRVAQCFDVFVFPSVYEGISVTVMENQAAGNLCFISSEIPQQCVITDNVVSISNKEKPEIWAEEIISRTENYKKSNMKSQIVKAEYDIVSNAKWLEEFYLNEYKKG